MDTGNTCRHKKALTRRAVHPRGYGKHPVITLPNVPSAGSSPWIRETLNHPLQNNLRRRFIPVDTGNTRLLHAVNFKQCGSSPWIRETPQLKKLTKAQLRFIPVDTGNTHQLSNAPYSLPVHPRGYGKHDNNIKADAVDRGSSPWIRETHPLAHELAESYRFIPVDTGNTRRRVANS